MTYKDNLKEWVLAAVETNDGEATLVQVAKYIWNNHEKELRASGDGFYTWQYDMRWAAQDLRDDGYFVDADQAPRGIWRRRLAAA